VQDWYAHSLGLKRHQVLLPTPDEKGLVYFPTDFLELLAAFEKRFK